jgi:hypothetical protein
LGSHSGGRSGTVVLAAHAGDAAPINGAAEELRSYFPIKHRRRQFGGRSPCRNGTGYHSSAGNQRNVELDVSKERLGALQSCSLETFGPRGSQDLVSSNRRELMAVWCAATPSAASWVGRGVPFGQLDDGVVHLLPRGSDIGTQRHAQRAWSLALERGCGFRRHICQVASK